MISVTFITFVTHAPKRMKQFRVELSDDMYQELQVMKAKSGAETNTELMQLLIDSAAPDELQDGGDE